MCNAQANVRLVPEADNASISDRLVSSGAIDDLLGSVIDHHRCVEILKLWTGPEHRLYAVLECLTVCLFRSINILPEVNAAASRAFVKQKSLVDQIRIGLPGGNRSPELGQDFPRLISLSIFHSTIFVIMMTAPAHMAQP